MKTLVVYYSRTGKTELVAKGIAEILNAELRKVEEQRRRRRLFGTIGGARSALREECSEIKPVDFALGGYNLIFLGTPVWAMKPTPAINAFIQWADFRGKDVILFVTMGGFGGESALQVMADKIKAKGGNVLDSLSIRTGGVRVKKITKRGEEIGRKYRDG